MRTWFVDWVVDPSDPDNPLTDSRSFSDESSARDFFDDATHSSSYPHRWLEYIDYDDVDGSIVDQRHVDCRP